MKTCPNCQCPLENDDLFCPNCGSKVEAQPNTPDTESSNPYLQSTNPYEQSVNPYRQPDADTPADPFNQPAANENTPADPFNQSAADASAPADSFNQPADPFNQSAADTSSNPYQQPNQQYQQPNQQYQQPAGNYYAQPQQPADYGINTTPVLVWSILNLLFCCMPLGIWSLILSTTVNKKPTREEAQKSYKTAKTICIVGTVIGALVQIGYLVVVFISAFLQGMSSY